MSAISNADGDEAKICDPEAPVVFYFSESESALPARDLANYLEYALRRDEPEYPPIVEEGTWEFANECFNRLSANRESLSQEELDALDRIAVSLDRLVEYDPAFNPFEVVEDDEDADDEDVEDEEAADEDADDEDIEDEETTDEDTADEDVEDEETADEDAADEDVEDEEAADEDAADEDVEDEGDNKDVNAAKIAA